MKLYSPSITIKANYTLWAQEDTENFRHAHDRLETLFEKRRIPDRGELSIPYGWSAIVLNFITLATEIDQHVMFGAIEERNGNLHVDFISSHIVDENEVEDLLYETRNRIDTLTHVRIKRALKMRVTDDAI